MIVPQALPSRRVSLAQVEARLVAEDRPGVRLPSAPGPGDPASVMIQAGPLYQANRIAGLVGQCDVGPAVDATTDHALLVVLGEYARHVGLIERLEAVPVDQRQGQYSPQSKLIELLVAVLGGLENLEDLNKAAHPLVHDQAVITSWGQTGFAHYSGVSRTLSAAGEETVQAVVKALETVSQPFIEAEVVAAMRHGHRLWVDVDLTGRRVSPTSTTYPEADFGWMDDEIAKGYQAAITSLTGGPCGRLLLSSQRYPGRTQSAECLQAAVRKMEQVLGTHPRRRTDLVRDRVGRLSVELNDLQTRLDGERTHQRSLFDQLQAARQEQVRWQAEVERQAAEFAAQGREERPHSRLAKARRHVDSAHKRQGRLGRSLKATAMRLAKLEHAVADGQADQTHLLDWLAHLDSENLALPAPVPCALRIDAGFSTEDNLMWLIELGYDVYTRVHSGQTTAKVRRTVPSSATWQRVGRNAEAFYLPQQRLGQCAYALDALLVRYQVPAGRIYTILLYYGDCPPPPVLKDWFQAYNGRQTIEAGIKEGKGIFPMRHPWVRSPIGLQLQEQFSLFAANLVRWAAAWIQQMVRHANRALTDALREIKSLVRDLAHCRARLVHHSLGYLLILDEHSPYADSILLLSGQIAFQYVLPLFKSSSLVPSEVK